MARPNWEYIRVDVLLPDNPKLDGLPASAKWTLIELWCFCGQHLTDGFVRDAKWPKFGTKRDREALVTAKLADRVPGGYQMHDFIGEDGHQRSRAEVLALKAKRADSGRKGGNARASAVANAKQVLEQTPEHLLKQISGKPVAEAEAEANRAPQPPASGGHDGSHDNCRACGTNRRGPPPAPVPTPMPPAYQRPNGHRVASEDVAGLLASTRKQITKEGA